MKAIYKGLLLAVLHIALVCTLGAKLIYDRAHRPRVWIKSAVYDPNLPIRGRYLSLTIEVPAEGFSSRWMKYGNGPDFEYFTPDHCDLVLRGDQLIAAAKEDGEYFVTVNRRNSDVVAVIPNQTAYFVPEHADSSLLRTRGQELWFEATIPRKGPPRPIRLGIKKDGVLTPMPQN